MNKEEILFKLKTIAVEGGDPFLDIEGWYRKIKMELENNSIEMVSKINAIPIELVQKIKDISNEDHQRTD
jgi:hypothetical protein